MATEKTVKVTRKFDVQYNDDRTFSLVEKVDEEVY